MSRIALLFIMSIACQGISLAADPALKLLFLGDQKSHQPAIRFKIIQPVLADKGIDLTYTEDVTQLNGETLAKYDGLVLYANIDKIAPDQAKALLDYVASGKGFVPIHCASYCFRNSPEVVALIGAQFQKHGTGEMTTESAGVKHPVVDGYETFRSWDETYVHHLHNDKNRVVLEYRAGDMQADGNTREPWTWIRTHGKGRVFYTAWGHDQRTWNQAGFQNLLERGIRWACGEGDVGMAQSATTEVSLPPMKKLASGLKPFDYVDVGPKIPNYPADKTWGRQEKPLSLMQQPASAEESMKHLVTPEGMHVELFADESMLGGTMFQGKPIAMSWDEAGRLWICETLDYPNELQDGGRGRDHIRILEDTDGDNRADKSTIFAKDLSIPTAIAFHRGGAIVQNGIETLYLKDTDGDGKADVRKVLISNWTLGDTHGGVSNFRYGLDNWIWAMQGYNNSEPVIEGEKTPAFRMGFFRFKLSQTDDPVVEKIEFVRSTTNNTWGLGISEEGLIFGSTANRAPSFFMPIANRYYERVKGWAPETLRMICPDHLFDPISDKVRQVDHHGGYTAAAGHALYTARNYPSSYWNRTAFVCGPTGKLVGTYVIQRDGAGMKSQSPQNLVASDDEWTAPIMAEVGPDGNVWVLDWYNYIVQHNPTPQGFTTGKGHAYESDLRDKKYGRIYRIVPDDKSRAGKVEKLVAGDVDGLIAALRSPTMEVRLHAQRLLVQRGQADIVPQLIALIDDQTVDAIGLNVGAIHALNVLRGIGSLTDNGPAIDAVTRALSHPSSGVRLNAIRVLPENQATIDAIAIASIVSDSDHQVVLAALLKISDVDAASAGDTLAKAASEPMIGGDRWLSDALVSAGAMHAPEFLGALLSDGKQLQARTLGAVERVGEHFARTRPDDTATAKLFASMATTTSNANDSIIVGLSRGWPKDHQIELATEHDEMLTKFFSAASPKAKGMMAGLANSLSSQALSNAIEPMIESMVATVNDSTLSVDDRIASASQMIQLAPGRSESIDTISTLIGPQSPTTLSTSLIAAMGKSTVPDLGKRIVALGATGTPAIRDAAMQLMLSRADLTIALLDSVESGNVSFSDLSAQQRAALQIHPTRDIRRRARQLMDAGGMAGNSDRQKLVAAKTPLLQRTGDIEQGKAVFTKNCATCHVFKGEGNVVGPNLNGMSVHPKLELLTHILDPNRSVEANYRLYNVLTVDGEVVSGLLSGETLTSIEMVDAKGKRQTILREDIEQLNASKNSAMPEGLEESVDDDGLVDLLEYLTQAEQFIPLGLESVANVLTTEGMFYDRNSRAERLVLPNYGMQVVDNVPFQMIDPKGTSVKNALMLHGPQGPFAPTMPKSVTVRCKMAVAKIHMLGGVAGWAAKNPSNGGVSMIVRLRYDDGSTEDHPLIDGQHIADYIGVFEVPQSKLAFKTLDGGQVRYLSIQPKRQNVIDAIELVKPDGRTAPVVIAITVERPTGNPAADR
ncbi:MAG: PVC-type heme-binding CxxCH protein [Pirellulaceae bacterium]